ncbi:hypothetical protein [Steroidobacter cummioxidans]|uniref:hypothetical protein n=1 Tax=Steroidobacter cummioxidans TaxID=1803913 RepID=UPI000E30C032|nr:hypothetical protein [Steroidobacter cummioxidans]
MRLIFPGALLHAASESFLTDGVGLPLLPFSLHEVDLGARSSLDLIETIGRERLFQLFMARTHLLNVRFGERATAACCALVILQRRFEAPEQACARGDALFP